MHLANNLHTMGFTSSLADPDMWFQPAVEPNGFQYYEYHLAYVDDIPAGSIPLSSEDFVYFIKFLLMKGRI